jgi:hypothetical protein
LLATTGTSRTRGRSSASCCTGTGARRRRYSRYSEAIKKKQNKVVPEEPKPDATTVEHREAVKRLVDAVTEIAKKDGDVELKELVSKLLDPLRELVQSIPEPA